ncbi:hypothetical protein ACLOJK_034979 [Asimina triloba]
MQRSPESAGRAVSRTEFGQLLAPVSMEVSVDTPVQTEVPTGRGFTRLVADLSGPPIPSINAFLVLVRNLRQGWQYDIEGVSFLVLECERYPGGNEGDRGISGGILFVLFIRQIVKTENVGLRLHIP